ncbi:hypothetical protein T03_16250 [Trichinella britovi]|uniref:Uncharacterized protein n=1 Tax=Trichinella britovi TaxID=45882 RepID=A0A0V0YT49_TRIBR|nr:hypothetical protein T03_16250 [Trichinella britovi]
MVSDYSYICHDFYPAPLQSCSQTTTIPADA